MKSKDPKLLYESLNFEEKSKLLDGLMESIRYTEKYILTITKWLAILVFLYYLLSNRLLDGFEIAGARLSKFEFVEKYFPFGVSCLILFYIIAGLHKAKCVKNYEILFQELYQKKTNSPSILYHAWLLLPLGVFKELQNTLKTGCIWQFFSWIYMFPILIIQLLPFIFMYDSLSKIYQSYWNEPYMKLVFFTSIWFIVVGAIKFCTYIFNEVYEGLEVQG